jgi:DNA-binding transcriptional LysR family regulator
MNTQKESHRQSLKLKNIETIEAVAMIEAVAKLGSLDAASKALGVTKSVLTKSIKTVEQELNLKLFNKTDVGLQPTEFVIPFLKHGSRILLEVENTKSALLETIKNTHPHKAKDEFRIAAGPRSCRLWVNKAIQKLSEKHSDRRFVIDHDLLYLYQRLINDEVDVGVTMRVLLPSNAEGVTIQKLGTWRAYFVCRPGHPLADIPSLTISDLQDYPLAGDYNLPVLIKILEASHFNLGQWGLVSGWLMSATQVNELDEMVDLVKSSDHIAILPDDLISDDLFNQQLIKLDIAEFRDLNLEVIFAYKDQHDLGAPLESLFEIVKVIEDDRHRGDDSYFS